MKLILTHERNEMERTKTRGNDTERNKDTNSNFRNGTKSTQKQTNKQKQSTNQNTQKKRSETTQKRTERTLGIEPKPGPSQRNGGVNRGPKSMRNHKKTTRI